MNEFTVLIKLQSNNNYIVYFKIDNDTKFVREYISCRDTSEPIGNWLNQYKQPE